MLEFCILKNCHVDFVLYQLCLCLRALSGESIKCFFLFVFFIVWLKSIYSHCRADEWVSRSRLPCCGTSRSCFCERPHLNTERWEYTVIMSIVSACALSRQRIICRVACSCKHRQSSGAWSYRIWCQTDYR